MVKRIATSKADIKPMITAFTSCFIYKKQGALDIYLTFPVKELASAR